jgi:glucose/arabinose dehydrogenase
VLDLAPAVNTDGEGGLLGLAFHPQFQDNGHVYLSYTGHRPGTTNSPGTHVIRFTLDPADPAVVIPGSGLPIFRIPRPLGGSHFAGWIGFAPDGYLYILSGDARDPANAQPLDRLLGKILRIDVDQDGFPADPVTNYAVPPTNPFFGSTTARPEIWARGVRNPWRGSFDRATGDFWFGDVGEASREEINVQPPGPPPHVARNYGWPCTEGTFCTGTPGCNCNAPALTPPVFEYTHSEGIAVIGGYVYRGSALPELQGAYFFADLAGRIWHFRYGAGGISQFTERTAELGDIERIAWGEGSDGELYYSGRNSPTGTYHITKIVRACEANCDGGTIPPVLNVADFICFQNRFATGDPLANCDGSTIQPTLNVSDFICFQSKYAAGCP